MNRRRLFLLALAVLLLPIAVKYLVELNEPYSNNGTQDKGQSQDVVPREKPSIPLPRGAEASFSTGDNRTLSKEECVRVVFFDIDDSRQITPSLVEYTPLSLEHKGLPSDLAQSASVQSDGRATLPSPGEYRLRAFAEGYVPFDADVGLTWGETSLSMQLGATLEIRVVDERSSPIPGVKAAILAPLADSGDWYPAWAGIRSCLGDERFLTDASAEPYCSLDTVQPEFACAAGNLGVVRVSGQDGIARWRGLMPGGPYRWGLVSNLRARIEPQDELEKSRHVSERGVYESSDLLSAEFTLRAGRTDAFRAQISTPGSVFGRVEKHTGGRSAVSLFDCRSEGAGIPAFTDRRMEASMLTDDDGTFFFRAVAPGTKLVRVTWKDPGQDFYFAAVRFDLAEGDSRDLGELRTREGSSVSGVIELVDPQGRRVDKAKVFRLKEGAPMASVHISARGSSLLPEDRVIEELPMEVGEEFRINGLPEGWLRGGALNGESWPRRPECRVSFPKEFELQIPSPGPLNIAFEVQELVSLGLEVLLPPGVEPQRVWAHFLAPGQTEQTRFKSDAWPAGHAKFRADPIQIEAGTYDLLVHAVSEDGFAVPSSYYCLQRATVEGGEGPQVIRVDLLPGASIEGDILDDSGKACPRAVVSAKFGRWLDVGSACYLVNSNELGHFVMAGLPPSTRVRFRDGTEVTTGPAESTVSVEVRNP